jgi:hypothetical protein
MDRAETVHASMTQRPLVETYPLVQRGLGVAAAKGGLSCRLKLYSLSWWLALLRDGSLAKS